MRWNRRGPLESLTKFDAKNLPNAIFDEAKGELSYKFQGASFKAKVQCLRVDRDSAFLLAEMTKGGLLPVGTLVSVDVFDSREPKGDGDQFEIETFADDICRGPAATTEIDEGNITVKDVP